MKRILLFISLWAALSLNVARAQGIREVYMPQYVLSFAGDDPKIQLYVCRLTLTGLTPNAKYRYAHGLVTVNAGASLNGSGDRVYPDDDVKAFYGTPNSATLYTPGFYREFTTDAAGEYTGWFISSIKNSSFYTGTQRKLRIMLNDGADGSAIAKRLTAPSPVTFLEGGPASDRYTAIRSTAAASGVPGSIVMLWDKANPAAGDRPVACAVVEDFNLDPSASQLADYPDYYKNDVLAKSRCWGSIVPNNLAGGIQKIAQYSLKDGSETGSNISVDGQWSAAGGGKVSTVNTSGGFTNVIVLDGSKVTLGTAAPKTPQTISFTALANKTYGDIDFNPGATASSSLPVEYTSSNTNVAVISNGEIHITGAGTTDITASQPGNDDYEPATPVTQTLTVQKAPLTIKADDKLKITGVPIPDLTVTYTGFVNNEDAAVLTQQPVVTTTATAASGPGTYPIMVSGAAADNYDISYVNGTLTITSDKQPQTINFPSPAIRTYGAPDESTGAAASSGLPLYYSSSNPAVAVVVDGKLHIVGAGVTTITASQPGSNSYEAAADVSREVTVNKAPLLITANNQQKFEREDNPTLTLTYTGFVYGESNLQLSAQPVVSTTATAASPAGTYPITVSGATADNYAITFVNGTLTIAAKATQTIVFDPLSAKTYGDADFTVTATASSGLPVTFTSSNLAVASIVNGTIHLNGAGTVTITAGQPGNTGYAAAADVQQTLTVKPARLVISAMDTSRMQGASNPDFTFTYNGFVNGDDESKLATLPMAHTDAQPAAVPGIFDITVSGAASGNYTIFYLSGKLTILPAGGTAENNLFAFCSSPGQLRLNIFSAADAKAAVQLFDLAGRRLLYMQVSLAKGYNTFTYPVGNVAPGVYVVKVAGSGLLLSQKVTF